MNTTEKSLVNIIKLSEKNCKQAIGCELAYATRENFLGRLVNGYHADAKHIALATRRAAEALCEVQNKLNEKNLGLFIFDSYRPLRSVKDFAQWMLTPVHDEYELVRKEVHYPHLEKSQLSALGYIANTVSNHCFGDTIDLSIVDLKTNKQLNMGAVFDYFDEISHPTAPASVIGEEAYKNRMILSEAMQNVGFLPFDTEFWHFTHKQRDVQTPIDIEITRDLEHLI